MRKAMSLTLATVLLACIAGFRSAEVQETTMDNQLFLVVVEHVKPSGIAEYEKATRDMIKELNNNRIDPTKVNFMAVSGPELGYAYAMPLEDFASMKTLKENWKAARTKIGEARCKSLEARADANVELREVFHCVHRTDLSFIPRNPRVTEAEIEFVNYTFFYPIPGQEENVEEIATQFKSLYERNGLTDSWTVYQAITGSDLPLFVIAFPAKSELDYAQRQKEVSTILGAEGEQLHQRSVKFARKVESKDGTVRPDLSYPAQKKVMRNVR